MKLAQNWLFEDSERSFPWHMFVLVPLAVPVGVPVWAPAFGSMFSLVFAVWFFGGEQKKLFNPLAIAMIFLVAGYSSVANFSMAKPFEGFKTGFNKYSSGISIGNDSQEFLKKQSNNIKFNTYLNGNVPGVPGNIFPVMVLALGFIIAMLRLKSLFWVFSVITSLAAFYLTVFSGQEWVLPPMHLLLSGTTAICILFALVEIDNFSSRAIVSIVRGVLFSFFLILLVSKSNQIVGPFYALILTEVFSPLIEDTLFPGKAIEVANEG